MVVVEIDARDPALAAAEQTHQVAQAGRFDLDHVRTLIREDHAGERTRDHDGQVEDTNSAQRGGVGHVNTPSGSLRGAP